MPLSLPRLPLVDTLRAYTRADARGDAAAGLTTAIMLVPQGMAYALLAGLDPIVGLYAATIPIGLYALFGTSRPLAVGPVAIDSIMVAAAVAPLAGGDPARWAALAASLALLVGGIHVLLGVLRLGHLVRYLTHPVVAGFTSAAALVIGVSQLKHLLGVPLVGDHVHTVLIDALGRAAEVNAVTVTVGLVALATLLGLKRYARKVPRFLVVVALALVASAALGLEGRGVAVVGEVPAGLPSFALPALDPATLLRLLPSALTIAAVAFMESFSVSQTFARRGGYRVDASQELVALGAANLGAAFFSAYPVTGGLSRTAVNAQAGARTSVAGLVTASAIVVTLLVLTPLFHGLPKAVLAAIIMSAVAGLVDVPEARRLWRGDRVGLGLMGLTFAATLALGIAPGLGIGVAAGLLATWAFDRPVAAAPAVRS